ncbi:acyltransferase family protein [Peribacillus sp. SCS-155]|uniref:acyltransferase family protein n=1 Tax=Peribacillus sedimenti TaxID=3115297 RepID=UPI0039069B95
MTENNVSKRYVDLDYIRVIVTVLVVLYHCTMFVNPFPWHIKNNELDSSYILGFGLMVGTWFMPIFFAISGISTFHALQKRSSKEFVLERIVRLGLPIIFGALILAPPQVYIERVSHHQFNGTFLDFLPHYFDGLYLEIGGTGNFAFMGLHLWYLLALLTFSLLTLPFIKWIEKSSSSSFGFRHYLLLPLVLLIEAVFLNAVNLGGWGLLFYLVIYMYGYIYFSHPSFRDFIRGRGIIFGAAALFTSTVYIGWFMSGVPFHSGIFSAVFTLVKVLNCWNWLLFIFWLGDRYFTASNILVKYGNKASLPIYILHQPVIVILGFLIYQMQWPIIVKLLILFAVTSTLVIAVYHFMIQRTEFMGLLFGIHNKQVKACKEPAVLIKQEEL